MQDELRQQNIAGLLARGLCRTRKKDGLPAIEPLNNRSTPSAAELQTDERREHVPDPKQVRSGGER